jgi:hypothetical protein
MRKIQILGLALFAVFAFGAISAASALAVSEWLVEGAALTAPLASETEGLLFLVQLEGGTTVLNEIDCEGIFDGTIGPGATDKITEVLNLADAAIGLTALTGLALNCTVTKSAGALTDCRVNTLANVWAINLPWSTSIELMGGTTFLDKLGPGTGGEPGYTVECEAVIGIRAEETCTGATSSELTNEPGSTPGSVLGVFGEAQGSEKGTCAVTGAGSADTAGSGNVWGIDAALERLLTTVS